eukprot:gnl/TRDRNA2_/TRDRNA2_169972_c18_seq1.p1 gnl/TRDRNA2_/TRDRNA2_169972_c18~~gnl/TRDRNA2_/TRDRNA2_169972_c18_seq1.p1  ORF type:complete len:350 (-),score=65.82 gnl/TRDRNA2_/TRDRNA2_169972_c18_seq1:67-1116(-)
MKQHYGNKTFLIAHPEGIEEKVGQAALMATYEALLENCHDKGKEAWFIDVSSEDYETAALASSLGCSVAAFDPDPNDAKTVEMTGCVNDPDQPFVVFPSMASDSTGANVTLSLIGSQSSQKTRMALLRSTRTKQGRMHRQAHGVAIDTVFARRDNATGLPEGVQAIESSTSASAVNFSAGEITMLKVTPKGCCGPDATLKVMQGARSLIKTGRVRCMTVELNFDKNSTEELLEFLHEVEHQGYRLAHPGPLDSPELDISEKGTYPLFMTDVRQLRELHDTFLKIRSFDERSGYRVYSDGLSLDTKGRYFDYTDLLIGCQGQFPSKITVNSKATLRYRDGMWWPEASTGR